MKLHLIAGPERFFSPKGPSISDLAISLGDNIKSVSLDWISSYQIVDATCSVNLEVNVDSFLLSLHSGFGGTTQPLLVLPGLLGSADQSATFMLIDRIVSSGLITDLHVHAFGLPTSEGNAEGRNDEIDLVKVSMALQDLTARLSACSKANLAVSSNIHTVTADEQPFTSLWLNILAQRLVDHARPRLDDMSLSFDEAALTTSFCDVLYRWYELGIRPDPLSPSTKLDAIAARALDDVFTGRSSL